MSSPVPPNEAERLAALQRYEILDTAPEQAFDDLTLLAAHICQVPTAMVSLIDESRQWFKSKQGLDATETAREIAFCSHTIMHRDQVMEVHDAVVDPRFAESPLVTEGKFRFYAGAPLVSPDGHALGALCVMDQTPRSLTSDQMAALQALSRRVVAQLELRRRSRELVLSRRALLSVLEDEQLSGQSLRESEERFRQMAENINEVFWMVEPATQRILYISPAYEKIWGRTCAEIYAAPETWLAAVAPEDRDRVVAAMKTRQETGEYREEYRIRRPDGEIRWIFDQAFPIRNQAGQVYRVVGIAQDITERKRLEEQFLRAQRLEAVGTLAGGIAHDLNNILAPVLMVGGLLKEKLVDRRDVALLDMMENSARRGAAIIRQLLMFSRGATGKRAVVQLDHLLKEMLGIMRETFPRDIALVETCPEKLRPVMGDATQLHQILMNLCVNARDAMPEGGKLTLRAEDVDLTPAAAQALPQAEPGRYVKISVQDTGHGIPAEIIERIFDPFFTTKEMGKGTGLGLSTVLGIVKSHDGFVTVQSQPGQGTTFDVYLPVVAEAGPARPVASEAPQPAGDKEMILLVDDEIQISSSTRLFLEKNNYRVVTAPNGREAVARFLEHQDSIKLVLTDLMMPMMGGVALIRALRSMQPNLPVIATTGLSQEAKRGELAQLGVAELLEKPYTPSALLRAVRRALARP